MSHAEHTVSINRPADEVFAFLADGTNNPAWRAGVVEISRNTPDAGEGATYRQVMSGPGGRRIDGDYRVTTYVPPLRLAFEVTAGPARPTGMFELSEHAGVTQIRFSLDLQLRGLMRLMTPMIARQIRREVAQLDNLKTLLESQP